MKYLVLLFLGSNLSFADESQQNNNQNNNQSVVIHNSCPKVEKKPKIIYKDRVVYKDRIVYKDKIVYKTKTVEKPIVRHLYIDKPRLVVKKEVTKIPPPKNNLSILGLYGEERFAVKSVNADFEVKVKDRLDVGLLYQRSTDPGIFSLGVTVRGKLLFGLGHNW
jgi:hypothetical protein